MEWAVTMWVLSSMLETSSPSHTLKNYMNTIVNIVDIYQTGITYCHVSNNFLVVCNETFTKSSMKNQ